MRTRRSGSLPLSDPQQPTPYSTTNGHRPPTSHAAEDPSTTNGSPDETDLRTDTAGGSAAEEKGRGRRGGRVRRSSPPSAPSRVDKRKGKAAAVSDPRRGPHPLRVQVEMPTDSPKSGETSPTEDQAGLSESASHHDPQAEGEIAGVKDGHRFSDEKSSSVGRLHRRALEDTSIASQGDPFAPHPTKRLPLPPAFADPDVSPLEQDRTSQAPYSPSIPSGSQENHSPPTPQYSPGDPWAVDNFDSPPDSNYDGGSRSGTSTILGGFLDDDEDALMLPDRVVETTLQAERAIGRINQDVDEHQIEHQAPERVSEGSTDTRSIETRRLLLPAFLQARSSSPSASANDYETDAGPPTVAASVLLNLSQRSALSISGPTAIFSKPSFRSINLESEPNPFYDKSATLARPSHLDRYGKSYSMVGHEHSLDISRSTNNAESSFLESDSFAARLQAVRPVTKARDSLAMRSRTARQAATTSSGERGPPAVTTIGHVQVLLNAADPCVCGYNVRGVKRQRTLSALNEDDDEGVEEDSLLGGKENSPMSSSGRNAPTWSAHAKRCVQLKDMRRKGWKVYRET